MVPPLSAFLLTIMLESSSNFASASTAPTPGYPSFHTTCSWSNTTTQGYALPTAAPSSGFTTIHSPHSWKSETHHAHGASAGYGVGGFAWPSRGTGGVAAPTGHVSIGGSFSKTVSPCRSSTITVTVARSATSTNIAAPGSSSGHISEWMGSSTLSESLVHSWSQVVSNTPIPVLSSTTMADVTPYPGVLSHYPKKHATNSKNCTLTGTYQPIF